MIPRALEELRIQLEQLTDDLHGLAYKLHPSLLNDAGLQAAIGDHIHKISQHTGLRFDLKIKDVPDEIPPEISMCLFRVMQESIHNIVKHANATDVRIKLSGTSKGIGLSVTDNGTGFDATDKLSHQKGLGLVSMEERVRYLNGFLRIHSRPADGTKVCAWIPFSAGGS
jgi:signal transduction histidine kinase